MFAVDEKWATMWVLGCRVKCFWTLIIHIFFFQFPLLKTIASRIVEVFLLFSVGNHSSSLHHDPEVDEEDRENCVQDVGGAAGRRLTCTRYQ
jgi:hypothetical protein